MSSCTEFSGGVSRPLGAPAEPAAPHPLSASLRARARRASGDGGVLGAGAVDSCSEGGSTGSVVGGSAGSVVGGSIGSVVSGSTGGSRALGARLFGRKKSASRRGFVRRLLADTRGTATTETVIMIPMFAIVWGCIFYVFTFFQRTIAMRALTRGHTWAYSYIGCSGSATGTTLSREGGSVIPSTTGSSSGDSGVDSIVSGLFGLSTGHGRRSSQVSRPRVLGQGTIDIRDELYVMCNDVPAGMGSYLADFAGRLLGFS